MRLTTLLLVIIFATSAVFAQKNDGKKYVQAKESIVGIYKNQVRQVYEEPLFKVGPDDRLMVYLPRNNDGQKGQIIFQAAHRRTGARAAPAR